MTPEMLELARRSQAEAGVTNAQFLQGTIEKMQLRREPVRRQAGGPAGSVSRPAARRRLAISDLVLTRPLPTNLVGLVGLWVGCVAGAFVEDELRAELGAAGFDGASIEETQVFRRADLLGLADQLDPALIPANLDREATIAALDGAVASAFIRAVKPA